MEFEALAERVAARERREDRNVYVANSEELRTDDPYNANESSEGTPEAER